MEETIADLRAHMQLDINKGGHSTRFWKTDSIQTIASKHKVDHKHYPKFLKHSHPEPKRVPAPDGV